MQFHLSDRVTSVVRIELMARICPRDGITRRDLFSWRTRRTAIWQRGGQTCSRDFFGNVPVIGSVPGGCRLRIDVDACHVISWPLSPTVCGIHADRLVRAKIARTAFLLIRECPLSSQPNQILSP